MGTSPVLPVLSFWPRVQCSEANSPCFFVRISRSPFLKGRRVVSSAIPGHTQGQKSHHLPRAMQRPQTVLAFHTLSPLASEESETQSCGPKATMRLSGGQIPRHTVLAGRSWGALAAAPASGDLLSVLYASCACFLLCEEVIIPPSWAVWGWNGQQG